MEEGSDPASQRGMYYPRSLSDVRISADRVLVHNNVRPSRKQGNRGARYWLQSPSDRLELCDCGWAPELDEHYRVVNLPT